MLKRICDKCEMMHKPVRRYTLRGQSRSGKPKSWGAGGIDLCDDCWTRICKPRMKPDRIGGWKVKKESQNASN